MGSCLTIKRHEEKAKDYCEGVPGQIAPGWGNPELLCHMAHSLGFYGDGAGFVTGEKRAGHKFWKNDIAQGHNINQLESDESKMADKSLNLNWQAKWDTRGATTAPKVRVKVVPNSLWSMDYTMEFSRPEHWSGSHSLLQGIFPTQGSNQGLLHCGWIFTSWATREALWQFQGAVKRPGSGW